MSRKWMFLFTVLAVLTLISAPFHSVQAQDPQPPRRPTTPAIIPHYPPQTGWQELEETGKGLIPSRQARFAQTESQAEVALGQPGLSFRYVQTFGVTSDPYLADETHLNYPDGIFVDASNNLYVAEAKGHRLLKFNALGANTQILGHAGQPWAHDDFLAWPQDAAKDSAGNIWVVFNYAALKEFDPSGNLIQYYPAIDPWIQGDTNDRFSNPNSIAFDSSGLMYIADTSNHRIQVYDVSGVSPVYQTTIGETGVPGVDNTHFDTPTGIAFDSLGRLYVMDTANYRVQRCTNSGGWTCATFFGVTSNPGNDLNHLGWAVGITVDGNNNVYIADSDNVRVLKCTTAGVCSHFAGVNSVPGSDNSHFNWPEDVAADTLGNVFVSDFENHRIQKFNSAGTYQSTIGVNGVPYLTDTNRINAPWGIAVNSAGELYVTENAGNRLLKLNAAGSQLWTVGEPGVYGNDNSHFSDWWSGLEGNPAIDSVTGRIFVPDTSNNRIQIFNSNGSYFTTLGNGWGTGNYEFDCPAGVAISPVNRDVYIVDRCNQRIQVYTSALVYKATLGETGVEGSDNSHFRWLWGVAVANNGNIFVADSDNHRIQKCNFTTGTNYTCSTFAGQTGVAPDGTYDHIHPLSVAVDASGRVYTADEWNSRVMVYNSAGAFLTSIGGDWSQGTGGLTAPSGVAVDSAGNVYVTDRENHRIQKFAQGVPNWQQVNLNGFGEQANQIISTLGTFNGALYAGTYHGWDGAQIWSSSNGTSWASVMTGGFGNSANYGIDHVMEFNGNLYAGTWSDNVNGGEVWRSSNGATWSRVVNDGFGDVNNAEVFRFEVFNSMLYASTFSDEINGAEVWRSDTGDSGDWEKVVDSGFGDTNNQDATFAVFGSNLYAGTWNVAAGGQIWRSDTGNAGDWQQINTSGFGTSDNNIIGALSVFDSYLYAAVHHVVGGSTQIWRCQLCDNSDWEDVTGSWSADTRRSPALEATSNSLYAVLGNNVSGLEVWQTKDGVNWVQIGFNGFEGSNNPATYWDNALTLFNNELYLGTNHTGGGGQIWKKLPITFPSAWAGGVSITADQNVIAVGRPEIGSQFMTYNGFNGGSTTAYVPMLFKDAFGGSYDAALYIQNLHPSNTANITIKYYDTNGNLTYTVNDMIARLSSKGYWLPGISQLGSSWVGAAVITSDQNIVAVGRPHIGSEILTYNGFASGSTTVYVPMLFKDAFGGSYDAALYVQNLHSSNTANITIQYYDTNGNLTHTATDTLARLSSKGYWLPGISQLGSAWVGAAVITSDTDIVAVGRPHIGSQIMTYDGFASGLTNAYVPMLFKDSNGGSYDSALYIQNVHPTDTANISLKFYDTSGTLTCTVNDTITKLSSKGYWLPGTPCLGPSWQGSVKVESDLGVVAVGRPHLGSEIMTYDGAASGSLLSYLPMLFRDAFGGSYDSTVYFLNTHTANPTNLTLTFFDATGNFSCARTDTIPARGTINYYLPTLTCDP